MSNESDPVGSDEIIGTISNSKNPDQRVALTYVRHENAFVTSGIHTYLAMKEILIPVRLIAADIQLIGAIISEILEKISLSRETNTPFRYESSFEVLGKGYTLTEYGEFMKLERD